MNKISYRLFAGATALLASLAIAGPAQADAKNIGLVHGMMVDGSGWKDVATILQNEGYHVTVTQNPLTGFDQDLLSTQRALDQQSGSTVLVGHSYGGMVITEAGVDPKVAALVYVAALQPDVGDTMGGLNATMPALIDATAMRASTDGYVTMEPTAFARDIASDLPEQEAAFLAASQSPTAASVFTYEVSVAAWHDKPSYAIVATADRTINPELERWMYARSKAEVTEIDAGHLVYMSHAQEVVDVIIKAAKAVP